MGNLISLIWGRLISIHCESFTYCIRHPAAFIAFLYSSIPNPERLCVLNC